MTPEALLAQIAALQSRVTLLTESHAERGARELLEEAAAAAAQAQAVAARRAASEPMKLRVLDAVKARAAAAAALDKAGSAFVLALQAMRDESQPIAADAQEVIVARQEGSSVAACAGMALPHAYGVSTQFAAALADLTRRCVAVLGRSACDEMLVLNDFTSTKGSTFTRANQTAIEQLAARL